MKDFTLTDIQNLIQARANNPLGIPLLDNRLKEYGAEFGVFQPYYRFFYHLAKFLQPAFIVELGGWQGTAAAHFAAGAPDSLVVSIDHHSDPGDELNQEKMLEVSREFKNLVYLQGFTWDLVESVKSFNKKINILFIDSWHRYEYAMIDWEDYSPLLDSPALVICDDVTTDRGPTMDRMDQFWDELPGEKFLEKSWLHSGIPVGFIRHVNKT